MRPVRAWLKRVGDGSFSSWEKFIDALRAKNLAFVEACADENTPGLLLFDSLTEQLADELTAQRRHGSGPIIAIALQRSHLGNGGIWKLMQAGADDVFVVEEFENPATAISARLLRVSEVDEFAR